ncbi:MAG TPA: hypothetical protein VMP01_25030 [Pirellulaceae bacterium]|nr:hypothetical protein [Pirellulaceae bacterium]
MKRFLIPLGLVLATLTFLVIANPAHAEERPIAARASGGLTFAVNSPLLVGEGLATHLGQSVVVVTLDEFEFAQGNFVLRTLEIYGAYDASLFASVDAAFDPETGIIAGTITFTGGAGRFADATGSADLLIVLDDSAGLFNLTFELGLEGTINY